MTTPQGVVCGYARVSSTDQDLAIQKERLRQFGCQMIREEKASGTSRKGRTELANILDFLRPGDTLVVQRMDRLARSLVDLLALAEELKRKGIALKATDQTIDTSNSAGEAFFQMLGVFAQFETSVRKERQLDGIAKAKIEGVYKGRKATIDKDRVWALHSQGEDIRKIAKILGISRASAYRIAQKNPDRSAFTLQAPEKPVEKPLDTHPLLS